AASTFLTAVLERISESLGLSASEHYGKIANSFLLSCDNAHAVHPNHPEYQDKNHAVYMNKGIVIKYNANQRYTSDAVSAAIFALVCEEAGVPFQRYANRADMPGGSTLGNIANTQVSLNTVDIGLPQLAMHSSFETAGAEDTGFYVKALACFYGKTLSMESDGEYKLG
ncbi:MAG: M18 family aminopeptidase, partial [Oscillospiraceae bacterium]|nr:M18 family aminopeptidase [Oscillospiraceae bacterium]